MNRYSLKIDLVVTTFRGKLLTTILTTLLNKLATKFKQVLS